MSVSSYEKDGKCLWKIYINIRDKTNPSVREQKVVLGFETEKAALAEEKKLVRNVTEKLVNRASRGCSWDSIIDKWSDAMKSNPTVYQYETDTIDDHVSNLRRTTERWLNQTASQLNVGDAREVFNQLEKEGRPYKYMVKIKCAISLVYKWGMEQKLIPNVQVTPVQGLKLGCRKEEKVPDILTIEEIRTLLSNAKKLDHPWYPIWCLALLTGMRNGELHSLLWSDIDLENRKITVNKSFHSKRKIIKSTKSGRWRTVPISDELFNLLTLLKDKTGSKPNVLPRSWQWNSGHQATVLRTFCTSIGIRPVCFHALRACFATQLLANNVAPARIMKICGWSELKTMQFYTRLAGVDERGATQSLRVLPNDAEVMREFAGMLHIENN